MLVAIYHMIKKEEDFHPIDQEEIIQNSRKTKGLNLTNVIAFLKEQGTDENTIRLVEEQCTANAAEEDAKEKQPTSGSAEASQPIQGSVKGSFGSTSNRVMS